MKNKLAPNDQIDEFKKNKKRFDPKGLSGLSRGNKHIYDHHFQTSSLKPIGLSKPNLMRSLLGKGVGGTYLKKWSYSHDLDRRHGHIRPKPLKIFFRTRSHMSRAKRKPAFCICENKDADQLRAFVFAT